MVVLRYLLMLIGIGLLVGAAGILMWDLYSILKPHERRDTLLPRVAGGRVLTHDRQ